MRQHSWLVRMWRHCSVAPRIVTDLTTKTKPVAHFRLKLRLCASRAETPSTSDGGMEDAQLRSLVNSYEKIRADSRARLRGGRERESLSAVIIATLGNHLELF